MPLVNRVGCYTLLLTLWLGSDVLAQTRGSEPNTQPGSVCAPTGWNRPEPRIEAERKERERWAAYREKLHSYLPLLPKEPDTRLAMPVQGARMRQVANTFGAARSGWRTHDGQDIFAPRGTPVYSATSGFVWRIGQGPLGGLYVFVVGPGGRRYYYAHLERYAPGLKEGQKVTTAPCSAMWAIPATPAPPPHTCTLGCIPAAGAPATTRLSTRCRCWLTETGRVLP